MHIVSNLSIFPEAEGRKRCEGGHLKFTNIADRVVTLDFLLLPNTTI